MDVLQSSLQRFFDSFPSLRLPELPPSLFWPAMAVCVLLIVWTSYVLVKISKLREDQARFMSPPHQRKQPAKTWKKGPAVIIDFSSAGQRLRNQKLLLNPGLMDRATAEELRAVLGTERNSFDFSKLEMKPGGDDDGPKAA